MLCCDTGNIEAIDLSKMTRIPMTVQEAQEMSPIVRHVRVVRSFEHGNGEVCIPFINGLIGKIKTTFTEYLNPKK